MRVAAVAESATTQSTTSSRIWMVKTQNQFNTECHKVLANRSDRHGTIADMDTCGAIVLSIGPENRDGWTQQVVDRDKKCCGAKSGHLGHLFESQMVSERQNFWESVGLDHKMLPFLVRHCAWLITHYQVKSDGKTPYERLRGRPYQGQVAEFAEVVHFRIPGESCRIKELANIEKLEVAEIMLQEARAQAIEIVYAGWLDDAAKGTPEDPAADRSSEDATITASRIMLSMAATKVIEKEQHHSTSDGWRSMTTWNENETDKCWEEVTSILTGELDVGVPMTYVSKNHGYVPVHRGINFPSSGSDAESNETGCVRMTHSDTKIMPRIKPTWYGGEMTGKTQLMQRNEMEPTGIRMEVKQQTCWAHGEAVETEAGIKGNTDAGHEGDGETTRHR